MQLEEMRVGDRIQRTDRPELYGTIVNIVGESVWVKWDHNKNESSYTNANTLDHWCMETWKKID